MQDVTLNLYHRNKIVTIRDHYEQLRASKLDNLEEIDKFLETYNLPWLNYKEVGNLNRPIISKEIELVVETSQKIRAQAQMVSLENTSESVL